MGGIFRSREVRQILVILFAKDTECRYVYTSEIEDLIDGGEEHSILGKTDREIQYDQELGQMYYEQDKEIMRTGESCHCYSEFWENGIKKHYHLRFQQKKEEEIARLAYRDLVTGVYNRNYFEQEKEKVDMEQLYAILSVSINHLDYIKSKQGMLYMENVLRKGVKVLQECTKEEVKIYRVSENIFYFWLTEPVQLENYVYELKETFRKSREEENLPMSFSIGAVYYNKIDKETMNELIARCEKMRLLDEKHAEANFIEGKMKLL